MRRDFDPPQADALYLESCGLPWEAVRDQGALWIIIHERPVPSGYGVDLVSTALMLPPTYPDGPIDMVYLYPALERLDQVPIGALSPHPFDGKQWQRWSRHRTPDNPWRAGEDDIPAHLILVDHWLAREFLLKPKP